MDLMNAPTDERAARARRRLMQHYDALGHGQDAEAWYEDPALDDLCSKGRFEQARSVVEIGCGTGRFAQRLLHNHLPVEATYFGLDLSPVMVDLSRNALLPFGERCRVESGDVTAGLPQENHSVDRIVAAFVLDLLAHEDIYLVLKEARRVLVPGGLFCAASMAPGQSATQRLRSHGWRIVQWLAPLRVGGCRPLSLPDIIGGDWIVQDYVQRNINNCAVASICAAPLSAQWDERKE